VAPTDAVSGSNSIVMEDPPSLCGEG
jgi:hypothetical protein